MQIKKSREKINEKQRVRVIYTTQAKPAGDGSTTINMGYTTKQFFQEVSDLFVFVLAAFAAVETQKRHTAYKPMRWTHFLLIILTV